MASKPVWRNDIERDAFIETNCLRCFQPDEAKKRYVDYTAPGCPHLIRAAEGKLPKAWTARRNAVMGETYRCSDFADKPPVNRRGNAPADTAPMFDVEPVDVHLVPVEGWPTAKEFGRKGVEEEDHQ